MNKLGPSVLVLIAACAGEPASLAPVGNGCPAGQELCGGSCVDTQLRPDHCGACDVVCAEGEVCSLGQCGVECLGGTTHCGDFCVDTMIDPSNCGECDVVCGFGDCVDGNCPCDDGAVGPGETDVDCGGAECAPCAEGDACSVHEDCGDGLQCLTEQCTGKLPPIDDSLVGFWRFESAGLDSSGKGNDATAVNAVPTTGKVGMAYTFGATSCVAALDSESLDMVGGHELTMMAWTLFAGGCAGTRGVVVNKESTYEMGLQCAAAPSPFQEAIQLSDGTWGWAGTGTVKLDEWHLLTVTWDSTTVRQYIDGVVKSTRMLSGMFADRAKGLGIGCRNVLPDGAVTSANSFFAGVIDEVAVYDRALTAAEIQAYYDATK
jgi:concanavalin A-like lectin/glucanase superfamily protein/stigma-specific protein Stig1